MTQTVVVRYEVRPESADENVRLVEAVYRQLAETKPQRFKYVTFRLDEGTTFIHIATMEGENPLPSLTAFGEFQSGLGSRCTVPPAPAPATVVGSYGIDMD